MITLTLLTSALSAPCADTVSPAEWAAEVSALATDVVLLTDGVGDRIHQLYDAAPCTLGPIENEDLARLWLARGAWLAFSGGSQADADQALVTARMLGGAAIWDPIYGPEVGMRFVNSPNAPSGRLTVNTPQDVLFVDGEIRYEAEDVPVFAGAHLVQWSLYGEWSGAWFLVSAENTTSIGVPDSRARSREAPQAPATRPVTVQLTLMPRYTALRSQIYVKPEGTVILGDRLGEPDAGDPSGDYYPDRSSGFASAASLRVDLSAFWLSLEGEFAPKSPVFGYWPAPRSMQAMAGLSRSADLWEVDLGAGLRAGSAPRARSPETWALLDDTALLPDYRSAASLAPTLSLSGRVGRGLGVAGGAMVWGGPIDSGAELRVGPTWRYGALEPQIALLLGGQKVARSAGDTTHPLDASDTHTWRSLEFGLGWRF